MPYMAKPVYALVGADPFLQVQELLKLLAQLPEDIDRVDIDGLKAEPIHVFDELRSFAMFGGTKVVVVRDGHEFISRHRDAVERYLANPSDSGSLVLRCDSLPATQKVHKAIARIGRIIPCEPPGLGALPGWIVKHAKSVHRVTIDPPAASQLAGLIGADLGRLDAEIGKLALMADDGRITAQTVASGVAFQREQEMYVLTDPLNTGDVTETLRRWRQLLQTDPATEFRAVTTLTYWLQKLAGARAMAAKKVPFSEIASRLRIFPKERAEPIVRFAERLGDAGMLHLLDQLVQTDLRSKSSLGEASANVERFLLTIPVEKSRPAGRPVR